MAKGGRASQSFAELQFVPNCVTTEAKWPSVTVNLLGQQACISRAHRKHSADSLDIWPVSFHAELPALSRPPRRSSVPALTKPRETSSISIYLYIYTYITYMYIYTYVCIYVYIYIHILPHESHFLKLKSEVSP